MVYCIVNFVNLILLEVIIMSRVCAICGKKPLVGNNVSHSNRKTKRVSLPNLQRVKAIVDGKPKYIKVCTKCLKKGKVVKA